MSEFNVEPYPAEGADGFAFRGPTINGTMPIICSHDPNRVQVYMSGSMINFTPEQARQIGYGLLIVADRVDKTKNKK